MKKLIYVSFLVLGLSGASVDAATQYWDADGLAAGNDAGTGAGLGGTGNWSTALSLWWDGVSGSDAGWTEGNDAIFYGTAGTVTLSGPRTANSLTFQTDGYIITASTLTNTAGITFDVQTGVATFGPNLLGTLGYTKIGPGILTLTNAANAIRGPVAINAGVLELTTSGRIGSTTVGAGDVTINGGALRNLDAGAGNTFLTTNRGIIIGSSGGTISLTNSAQILQFNGLISGAGNTLTVSGGGELRVTTNAINSAFGHYTFGKLVVDGAMYTLGQATVGGAEDSLGAVPSVTTDDAITLRNGGRLRGNVYSLTLDSKRGITLGAGGGTIRQVSSGLVLSIPGAIKGSNPLTIGAGTDGGTVAIGNPANSFGNLTNAVGVLRLDAAGVIPDTSMVTVTGGTLALNSFSETVGDVVLSSGTISGPGALTGTSYDVRSGTCSASLAGSGAVTKTTSGTVTLSSTNTYTGATAVNAGKLITTTASSGAGSYSVADGATNGVKVASAGTSLNESDLTLGNSRMEFDFAGLGNPTAPIVNDTGTIAVNGTVTVDIKGFSTNGAGVLLQYAGARSGAGSFVLGTLPPHVTGALTDDIGNKQVILNATNDSLRWIGDVSGNWDVNNAANTTWQLVNGGTATYYQENALQGDTVRFDDNATGTAVTILATVTPYTNGTVTVSNSSLNYSFTGAGRISGSTSLTKDGTAQLTLGTTNAYTGGTILNAGSVAITGVTNTSGTYAGFGTGKLTINGGRIKSDSATARTFGGSVDLNGNVTLGDPVNTGDLTFSTSAWTITGGSRQITADTINSTISSVIGEDSAGRALTKAGGGTLSLTAANTFTGGFTHNAGTVRVNNAAALGAANSPASLADGVTLSTTAGTGRTLTYAWTVNGNVTLGQASGGTAAVTLAGTMDLGGATRVFTLANATDTISAVASNGGIRVTNNGATLLLTGANTYTGETTVTNGATVQLNGTSTLGDGSGAFTLGGKLNTSANRNVTTAPVANPLTLVADSEATTTSAATTANLNFSNPSINSGGFKLTLRNDGADAATDSFEPRFSGGGFSFTGPIEINNGAVGKTRFNLFNTNTTTQTFSGVISGNGSLNRSASSPGTGGTTILIAANTYSGGTTINDGTLLVNNISGSGTGTGTVIVNSPGTLGGTGTISGAVTVTSGGKISPGASAGSITLQAGLDLSAAATYVWELGAYGTNPGDFDQVVLTGGNLVLGGTSKISVNFTGTAASPDAGNAFWSSSHSWVVASLAGGSNPGDSDFFSVLNGVYTNGYFTTSISAGNVSLNFTPGPSPQPQITSLTGAGGNTVTLDFTTAIKGATYQVQYKNDLNDVSWSVLGSVVATGSSASINDNNPSPAQRFYRIVIL